jgi:hypothetical protein
LSEGIPYSVKVVSAETGKKIAKITTPPRTRFDVVGDVVYVADWDELGIYQRSGTKYNKVSSIATSGAVDVQVVGNTAVIADFYQGLIVVDVTNPASPTTISSDWLAGNVDSVALHGNVAYLGAGSLGVHAVDLSDPASPSFIGTIEVTGTVVDVSVGGGILVAGTDDAGVEIYSIHRTGEVVHVATHETMGWVEDTAVRGQTLFVRDHSGRVEVIDIRVPAQPTLKLWENGGQREHVFVKYGYDTVAEGGNGANINVYAVAPIEP